MRTIHSSPKSFSPLVRVAQLVVIIGAVFLLFGCASTYDYTAFKESRPRSILVMPPVNQSLDTEAPLTFLATSTWPLAEAGYYVIPVTLSDQMFKQNGVTVAEEALNIDYHKLHDIFGADAALYITVTSYGAKYMVIDSKVDATASARLIDLKTGEELWSGTATAQANNSAGSSGFGILGALVTAAVNQAINTLSDKSYQAGRSANHLLLLAGRKDGVLYGPYSPKYQTD